MADLDNVMKGLDSCIKQGRLGIDNCRELGCPYFENGLRLSCWIDVLTDALELLKELQLVDNCSRCRFKDKCLTGGQLDR